MQRRPQAEERLAEVVLRGVRITASQQLMAKTDARLHGEASELMLHSEKNFVVERSEEGIVAPLVVSRHHPVGQGIRDQIVIFGSITGGQAYRDLTIFGIGTVIDQFAFHCIIAFFFISHHDTGMRLRKRELPGAGALVLITKARPVDTDRQVVTLVVKLMLVIESSHEIG